MRFCNEFDGAKNLKTEHLVSPLGIDNNAPRLSWQTLGESQKSYALVVDTDSVAAAAGKGSAWSTGVVETDKQNVVYAGKPLKPFTTYFWRVETVGKDGKTNVSPVARFETGMMSVKNWQGSWISDNNSRDYKPAPYFRKTFNVEKHVKTARAYISAGGLFTLSVNGKKLATIFSTLCTPAMTGVANM